MYKTYINVFEFRVYIIKIHSYIVLFTFVGQSKI